MGLPGGRAAPCGPVQSGSHLGLLTPTVFAGWTVFAGLYTLTVVILSRLRDTANNGLNG